MKKKSKKKIVTTKHPRKRWKRSIDSFKVGQFYRRPFGKGEELILMVDRVNKDQGDINVSLFGNRVYTTIISSTVSSSSTLAHAYSIGKTYWIAEWEYPYIKLMRFKKQKNDKSNLKS